MIGALHVALIIVVALVLLRFYVLGWVDLLFLLSTPKQYKDTFLVLIGGKNASTTRRPASP